MRTRWRTRRAGAIALWTALTAASAAAQQGPPGALDGGVVTLRTTVRRVIVDVVVTGRDGRPVPNLTRSDFAVFEDGEPQQVLSFDAFGFKPAMDYTPPKMPPLPANSFMNLPATPERGPLYVLLYDLVNVEKAEDQAFARKQLVKFIENKPEGTRFAIFMLSDGLHLVQGFTADKRLLYAAIDPRGSRPHVPKIFLMGKNFGQNDRSTAVLALKTLARYLDGLPGRKNVIWLAGGFPLTLFPSSDEPAEYIDEAKQTLNLLASNQIAIYPVDVRGVSVENPHAPSGSTGGGGLSSDSREQSSPSATTPAAGSQGLAAGGIGYNELSNSYAAAEEIARVTGGYAFLSTNDVAAALTDAVENGASYYTLSYAPSNREYDDKLHRIRVDLARNGYTLAYRRAYYGMDPNAPVPAAAKSRTAGPPAAPGPPGRKVGDSLDANMRHGAPMAHDLVFGAHLAAAGPPAMATAEQMMQLADEPAFFKTRRRNAAPRPLAPILLQRYRVDYTITARQFATADGVAAPILELAVAAFDAEGVMLNAAVNLASRADVTAAPGRPIFRVMQELPVPINAATLRFAVRDTATDRIGAMEVALPLQTASQPGARPAGPERGSGGAP